MKNIAPNSTVFWMSLDIVWNALDSIWIALDSTWMTLDSVWIALDDFGLQLDFFPALLRPWKFEICCFLISAISVISV